MSWYLTWQDGVALALATAGLLFVSWLRRRIGRCGGCARCPMEWVDEL